MYVIMQDSGRATLYAVDKVSTPDWKGEVGYVTKDMVQKFLLASSKDNVMMMVCGSMSMMKSASGPKLPDFSQGEARLMSLTNSLGCAVFLLIAFFCFVSLNGERATVASAEE
ncbi:hypothetical protein IW144_001122 [Coemansia sp. RSA 522]|nr:hypothetical protein IW144_001122 [Coemansia sp. RSA 522]